MSLDTEFIGPFLNATVQVLKVQANIESKTGKVYIKKPEDKSFGDVSGVISIDSEAFTGTVMVSFSEKTFLNIMSAMLGETYEVMNQDLLDGAGEITNMIFGQAKVVLNERGYGIKMAIPTVVSGKNHTLSTNGKGPIFVIPFESQAGPFVVHICV